MDILANIVTSRLWVLGSTKIAFGDALWQFYYSVEGVRTKTCHLLFFDPKGKRIYLKLPVIGLKVKNVIIQKCCFVSNVYRLLMEWTQKKGDGLTFWDCSSKKESKKAAAPKVCCGIVSQSFKETYFCASPIMVKDTFAPLKAHTPTQHFIIQHEFNGKTDKQQQTTSVAGYTVYSCTAAASSAHDSHFNKTWVPSVTVDSTTFDCSFEVVYTSRRRRGECLECALKEHGVYSPAVSNLLVNH